MPKINRDNISNISNIANKALAAAFKEFNIKDAEENGKVGLSCEHKSREAELEMAAALTLFIYRFTEASMGMHITIIADKPNQELMLIKRYHEILAETIDKVRDDFMNRVADNDFISSRTEVKSNEV
jgi:hypothetical protein